MKSQASSTQIFGLAVLLLTLCFTTLDSLGSDYTVLIVQKKDGVPHYLYNLPKNGSVTSEKSLGDTGSTFELHAVMTSTAETHLLDSIFVAPSIPSTEVEIVSQDPYEEVPRTRVDQPFSAIIKIAGISHSVESPLSARSVRVYHHTQAYDEDDYGQTVDRSQATLLTSASITDNGDWPLNYASTSIAGIPRSEVKGEETFSIYSTPDPSIGIESSQLASAFIQIWPLTRLEIQGLDEGTEISGRVPEVTISLEDLYPDSYTYVQIYPGNPVLNTEGTVIPGASRIVNSATPENSVIQFDRWDEYITIDGTWTLEVLTKTPFGTDRLAYRTFEVNRTITVNGSITSSE